MRNLSRLSILLVLCVLIFALAAIFIQVPVHVAATSPASEGVRLVSREAVETEEADAEEAEEADAEEAEEETEADADAEEADAEEAKEETEEETEADADAEEADAEEAEEETEEETEVDAEGDGAAEEGNPFTGDEEAIEEGQQLFLRMNCHGCHGREGGGGMGPSLVDARWNFGGDDATVFATIQEGRGGMPGFGHILEDEEIWKVIAFIRSIYRGSPESIVW